jgi:hypothetical protein
MLLEVERGFVGVPTRISPEEPTASLRLLGTFLVGRTPRSAARAAPLGHRGPRLASDRYAGSSPCGSAPGGHVWSFQLGRRNASWIATAAATLTACLVVCSGTYPTSTVLMVQSHAGYSSAVNPCMMPSSRAASRALRCPRETLSGQRCSSLTDNTNAGEHMIETWPYRGLSPWDLTYLPSPRVSSVHRTTVGESHSRAGNRNARRSRANVTTVPRHSASNVSALHNTRISGELPLQPWPRQPHLIVGR